MRIESLIFAVTAVFLAVVTPIYWFMSNDPTGTTALTLSFGLGAMIAFYFMLLNRRIGARPEDREDGEVEELAGEYGFFSPHSWWPLMGGASAMVVFVGLVYAWFILIIGLALVAITVIGWVFEYYRGEHAH
ncbi:cytochrome c oxidase subunit 4 [Actinobacteria bacterium YIM 96077]|uniref:Cytochrome c oxidase polypeptide 4 n=1 Tax=Phytoactinopolyspora halophila TaxID=1981511 RepID=A0A329QGZ1_9ACTN|nr:cytochrome c oxidase subunit 4 [Phytoactinopolyspora halophila]AYY13678.1 cytochrome c oxidase subunit 4 [Actinobacteria bacterium YIM 96077]RAW11241.1 cytochrome c oxidase subunit 4 [Phytoactinopolyspora halophila]